MTSSVKGFVVLCSICLVVALLLSGVNAITSPVIEAAKNAEIVKSLSEVYPGAEKFTEIDIKNYPELPKSVKKAYKVEDLGGYVISLEVTGYSSGLVILVAIDAAGAVVSSKVIAHSESDGYGADQLKGGYPEKFDGVTLGTVDAVDTVGGVTKTTAGYKKAIKEALGSTLIFSGGSFDARTEEEINRDNALPGAEGSFVQLVVNDKPVELDTIYEATNGAGYVLVYGVDFIAIDADGNIVSGSESEYAKAAPDTLALLRAIASGKVERVFITEKIEGLNSIYKYVDGSGYVLVYGDDYIGIDADGNVVGGSESEHAASAASDLSRILSVTTTAIDFSAIEDISKYVESMELTSSGNYVVVVGARGYDAQQSYSPTKALVKIRLCIDKHGNVISIMTLSQNESAGVGDVCANPDYYNRFNGVNADTVDGVDTVSGATITTKAYRNAVKNAINAVNLVVAAQQ